MGLLLKLALFGFALYAVWKTFARWKGLYDRFVGRPPEPPARTPAPPPPQPATKDGPRFAQRPPPVVEDTRACAVCGAYVSVSVAKCDRSGCPQP